MNKIVKPGRIALLTLTLVGLIVLYVTELYKLQILDAEGYYEQSASTITTTETVTAARGNLMDRYGRVLVSNRECYNIMINSSKLFGGSSEEEIATANAALLDMVDIIRESGLEYTDELPVTTEPPFEYRKMSSVEQTRLEATPPLPADEAPHPALARNRRRPARRLPRLWLAALLFGLVLAVVLFVLLRPGRKDAPVPPVAPAAPAQQIHIRPLVAAGPPEPTPPPAARPAEGDAPAPAGSLRLGELQVRPSGRD